MLACWVEEPEGDYFKKHLARLHDFVWIGDDGLKFQVRSFWDGNMSSIYLNVAEMIRLLNSNIFECGCGYI